MRTNGLLVLRNDRELSVMGNFVPKCSIYDERWLYNGLIFRLANMESVYSCLKMLLKGDNRTKRHANREGNESKSERSNKERARKKRINK